MKLHETQLNLGGVFRCCSSHLAAQNKNEDFKDGHVIKCPFCENGMLTLTSGVWYSNIALQRRN